MRQLLRIARGLLLALLPGCGFHLRGQAPLPAVLATPYLETSDRYTPLYAALEARAARGGREARDRRRRPRAR